MLLEAWTRTPPRFSWNRLDSCSYLSRNADFLFRSAFQAYFLPYSLNAPITITSRRQDGFAVFLCSRRSDRSRYISHMEKRNPCTLFLSLLTYWEYSTTGTSWHVTLCPKPRLMLKLSQNFKICGWFSSDFIQVWLEYYTTVWQVPIYSLLWLVSDADGGALLISLTRSHSVGCLWVYYYATTRSDYRITTEMDPRYLVAYGKPIFVDRVHHMDRCTLYLLSKSRPVFVSILVCLIDITCRGE